MTTVNFHILFTTVLVLAVAAAAPATAQTYYKWIDDIGTVHYTARPPADRDYERVDVSAPPPSNSQALPQADAEPAETAEDVQMPRRAAPDPEVVRARCRQARENLFWLESKQRIRVEEDDGSQRFVDADERERLIDEARTTIEEWCTEDG